MSASEPSFTLGIEEEYFLVDRQSRDLVRERPEKMMAELERRCAGQIVPEFLNAQIEVGTKVCGSLAEARADLATLRRTIAEVAGEYGLAIIAASTHPFAAWGDQTHTNKERYNVLASDLQAVARRLLICGMHVHVALDDDELRIDLLGQVAYFLPHLLALSTSSPFWRGEDTGLKSYRIAVFDELPRTGLPEQFDSWAEYDRHVGILVQAGLIEDASKLWWDIRPSARFPTLEMRLCDVPTRLDDTLCIAALYRCILHMLYRLRRDNQRWRRYRAMLIAENRWRAQRYGIDDRLVDFGKGRMVDYTALLDEIRAILSEDAQRLGCEAEVAHASTILQRGTSAHHQTNVFRRAKEAGADRQEALIAAVDWLIEETVAGI
ncbi:MAG: carboxylate-amine ligase [Bauldia litoralis]